MWRAPHNPTAYDDDFEGQPAQSPFHQWILGAAVPFCLLLYGVHVLWIRQATYSYHNTLVLHGLDALAYGIATISVALFLHFHYFWGNIYDQVWWAVLGKIISAAVFIISTAVILVRVGVLGK
ncbi:MAG TPA: hypothetical protein VIM11_21870 [Tepidisphaeraceae bacterium]|jgi:hypothetical protein